MQSLKNKIYARKIAQECLSFSEYPIKWMNPKQFLVFYTVGIIWFFRIFNGTGSGGKVPTLLSAGVCNGYGYPRISADGYG